MNECRMVEFCPCKIIGIIISAILGIAAGALLFNGIITLIPGVLWFFIIAAAIALAVLIGSMLAFCIGMCESIIECFCKSLGLLLTGSIGTILAGLLLLVLSVGATITALIFALLIFFFALFVTGIVCFLLCVCDKECPSCSGTGSAGNSNCNCCCCYPCNCESNTENSNSCKLKC